jgi:hypothetical protein
MVTSMRPCAARKDFFTVVSTISSKGYGFGPLIERAFFCFD